MLSGSSPLARGLRLVGIVLQSQRRIIPARAGFTGRPDRPRRGHIGSSPLARGLRRAPRPPRQAVRIIPARAGFTQDPGPVRAGLRDHPRSRGVYTTASAWGRTTSGSSPLARGLRVPYTQVMQSMGIIPARAGFTPTGRTSPRSLTDHPRSRGVYVPLPFALISIMGSSPLARGLRQARLGLLGGGRIIPARAGFTGSC